MRSANFSPALTQATEQAVTQADAAHSTIAPARSYLTPLGYSDKRPAGYPAVDRSAVMREAHRIAKLARPRFNSYREALVFGLRTAWQADRSNRTWRSLAGQVTRAAPSEGRTQSSTRRRRPDARLLRLRGGVSDAAPHHCGRRRRRSARALRDPRQRGPGAPRLSPQ